MNWGRLFEIARWEFLQKVRSKGFVISLVLLPVMILGFSFLPSILMTQDSDESKQIGLIDQTGEWGTTVTAAFEQHRELDDGSPAWIVRQYALAPSVDSSLAQAVSDTRNEITEGYLEIGGTASNPEFVWRSSNLADIMTMEAVENTLQDVVTKQRLEASGLDSGEFAMLTANVPLKVRKLPGERESEDDADAEAEFLIRFFSSLVGILLFMILIMTTGQSLVRGLVEEKSNRIMDILVGSSTSNELMWGKLLGMSALGLTQVLAWGLLVGVGALFFASSITIPGEVAGDLLRGIPFVLLYLTLGYLLYAAIFIGAGSLVTTEQEAQYVTQYLTMLLVAPVAFGFVVMQDPNAGYVEALSYVPLLTPTLMMLRVVTQMPSAMTLITTTVILIVSTIVVIWAAARIFRTAILLQGKRPSVREIMRWLKAG